MFKVKNHIKGEGKKANPFHVLLIVSSFINFLKLLFCLSGHCLLLLQFALISDMRFMSLLWHP